MFILSLRARAANFFFVCLVWWCFICPIHLGATLDQGVDLEDWLDLSMNYLCVYLFAERVLGYFSCFEVYSQKMGFFSLWVFPMRVCGRVGPPPLNRILFVAPL